MHERMSVKRTRCFRDFGKKRGKREGKFVNSEWNAVILSDVDTTDWRENEEIADYYNAFSKPTK